MSASSALNAPLADRLSSESRDSVDEPTLLAYRRPEEAPAEYAEDGTSSASQLPAVVLRLPDLDEPLPQFNAFNWSTQWEPIVSKVLIGAIAVLGLLLLVLMWRGVGSKPTGVGAAPAATNSAPPVWLQSTTTKTDESSTTPLGPFRVPMVGQKVPKNPLPSPTASNPPVAADSQAPRFGRPDAPPDMPRYAPHAAPPPAQVADRRAIETARAPIGQSQIPAARFQNTIDTPNMEPSYDGTRSRLR